MTADEPIPTTPSTAPQPAAPASDPGPDEALLVAWLSSRDVVCPVCSYNLRDLKTAICPECSARLRLQVGSENLSLGPWALAALSFALALGFDAVITTIMTIIFTVAEPPSPHEFFKVSVVLISFYCMDAACGLCLFTLFRRRKHWARMSRRAQWRTAWAIFFGVGVVHLLFGFGVMTWMK